VTPDFARWLAARWTGDDHMRRHEPERYALLAAAVLIAVVIMVACTSAGGIT